MTHPLADGIVRNMRVLGQLTILRSARQSLCLLLALAVAWSGLPPLVQTGTERGVDQQELRQVIHTLQALSSAPLPGENSVGELITSLRILTGQRALLATPATQETHKIFVVVRSDQFYPQGAIELPAITVSPLPSTEQMAILTSAETDIPTPPPRHSA